MTALTTPEDDGIRFPLALDGELVIHGEDGEIFPSNFSVAPTPIQDHVDTIDGGSQTFQTSFGPGHSDFSERHIFTIPYNTCNGPMRKQLERARKMGRIHSFAYWKPQSEFYTAPGVLFSFYLPHYRRNAAVVFGGLNWRGIIVDTEKFPMRVWLAGAEQVVAYEDGPVLSVPAAGTVNVSKLPDSTGHVPFRFHSAITKGQVIEVEYFPVFYVSVSKVTHTFSRGMSEQQQFELQER